MPDYQKMYYILFRAVTKAIDDMQKAQITTEEIYIGSEPVIKLFNPNGNNDDDDKK